MMGSPTNVEEARQLLVLRYAPAMRRYLGRLTSNPESADDLAQDALVRLLRGDFAGADPNRGRFRDLLKAAIRNLARHHWAREARRRPKEFDLTLLASEEDNDSVWLADWRKNVLDHAWAVVKCSEETGQHGHPYTVLQLRTEHPDDSSEQLAGRLATILGTSVRADAFRQMLRRARMQFAEAIRDDVGASIDDASPARIEEELVALELWDYLRSLQTGE
jgi:RNA polymerase sigma factor (sigma-70 family)